MKKMLYNLTNFVLLIGVTLALISCVRGGLVNLIGNREPNPICGSEEYNEMRQICYEGTLYDWCCSETYGCLSYDPATEGCSDSLVLQKCGSDLYNPSTHSCKFGTLTVNSTFKDNRDNRIYKYATIGDQVWMAENLRYGEKVNFYDRPESDGFVRGDYYTYMYGPIYKFNEAKKACPKGWHLPTIDEWQKLVNFAGGNAIAGKRLKAERKWEEEHTETKKGMGRSRIITNQYMVSGNGTDDYGFSAIPYGRSQGEWWSATEGTGSLVKVFEHKGKGYVVPEKHPLTLRIKSSSDSIEIDAINIVNGIDYSLDYHRIVTDLGLSVRCIADESEAQRLKAQQREKLSQKNIQEATKIIATNKLEVQPKITSAIAESSPTLKECDAVFNPNKKFCYDGGVYDLCDGVPYNPSTHICSGDIAYRALCNGTQYNPLSQKCENNILLYACGGIKYDPATQGCKDNVVLPKCGTDIYDSATHVCKDNAVFLKCGEGIYDPKAYYCKDNTAVAFSKCGEIIYDPKIHGCKNNVLLAKCGDVLYDPRTEICKDNAVFASCGKKFYNPQTHGCKDNVVLPKCGRIVYDPTIYGCKDNVLLERCGATEFYNPKTQECRFGSVFEI